jgi:adenylate cyclase
VNVASRMETTGEPGRIQVSPATHALIRHGFACEERGVVEVRGKGPMHAWFLLGRKSASEVSASEVSAPEVSALGVNARGVSASTS